MRRNRLVPPLIVLVLGLSACAGEDPSASSDESTTSSSIASRNGEIPTFSRPTELTNSYLPFGQGGRWIYEGTKDGRPYLVEVAVTSDTRSIDWGPSTTEARVVRHRGWVDGVIVEEARDFYAQGDDGGMWYFGEDVENYEDGQLADHDGTWLAGQDGALPALLMPGEPAVGEVFYSEDVAGLDITERDEVLSLTEPAETPDGPVSDGLLLGATQEDGTEEEKVFAPGVGEVLARSDEGEVRLTRRLPDGAESATEASFGDSTTVDNPYFGVSGVDYRLYLGEDEGEPIRIEVGPTGATKAIEWEAGTTDTVVSQFLETSRRDLLEVAWDWFAQDDTGNVWYFGEDVRNYDEGRIADTDGSRVAGVDGPPGLIMPGQPSIGRRFNPENIPGNVFETVDVSATDQTYTLANGQVLDDVVELHELLDDGTEETKLYARGYGNVNVRIPGVEAVDLVYALPNDAIDAPAPVTLTSMRDELRSISVDGSGDLVGVAHAFGEYRSTEDPVPPVLLDLAATQLDALDRAEAAGDPDEMRASALDVELTVLDLLRLYDANQPADVDRLDLEARRLLLAVDAEDDAAAATAVAIARALVDRLGDDAEGPVLDAVDAAEAAARQEARDELAIAAEALRRALA
jgi:hypothetical protein